MGERWGDLHVESSFLEGFDRRVHCVGGCQVWRDIDGWAGGRWEIDRKATWACRNDPKSGRDQRPAIYILYVYHGLADMANPTTAEPDVLESKCTVTLRCHATWSESINPSFPLPTHDDQGPRALTVTNSCGTDDELVYSVRSDVSHVTCHAETNYLF